jgi:hypothetical protein
MFFFMFALSLDKPCNKQADATLLRRERESTVEMSGVSSVNIFSRTQSHELLGSYAREKAMASAEVMYRFYRTSVKSLK